MNYDLHKWIKAHPTWTPTEKLFMDEVCEYWPKSYWKSKESMAKALGTTARNCRKVVARMIKKGLILRQYNKLEDMVSYEDSKFRESIEKEEKIYNGQKQICVLVPYFYGKDLFGPPMVNYAENEEKIAEVPNGPVSPVQMGQNTGPNGTKKDPNGPPIDNITNNLIITDNYAVSQKEKSETRDVVISASPDIPKTKGFDMTQVDKEVENIKKKIHRKTVKEWALTDVSKYQMPAGLMLG